MVQEKPSCRIRWGWIVLFAALGFAIVCLWPVKGGSAVPLSILKGVEPYEIREPRFDSKGRQASNRRRIYRLQMPLQDVLAIVRKELPKTRW